MNTGIFKLTPKTPVIINKSSEISSYTLMHMDIPLVDINEKTGEIYIHEENKRFFPIALQKDDLNFRDIESWASRRTLLLDRINAKLLLNACSLPQNDKYQIARASRFLTIEDCFWIKEKDNEKWVDFDLKTNSLSEALSIMALDGNNISLSGNITTPEFLNLGAYAKAWKREEDGLYLYKKSMYNKESEKEILVSEILDLIGIDHVKYLPTDKEDVCKCKCMVNENYSRISFSEFKIYCKNNGLDPYQYVIDNFRKDFMKMTVVDYLINNTDRHNGNWGFFIDNETGKIVSLHPLFDHNLAFGSVESEYYKYPDIDNTIKELAVMAEKELQMDLSPLLEMDKEKFINLGINYDSFIKRVELLNDQLEIDFFKEIEGLV